MYQADGFGELLRRYRLAAGLTQAELAEHAQISLRGLSDLERGLHLAPQAETQRRLADALGLGPSARLALRAAARKRGAATASTGTGWALPLYQPLSSFVGRQRELSELREMLARERLLTLTGAGGVGKTRLALRLAQEASPDYQTGVVLVELATVSESVLIPHVVARSLGAQEQRGRALLDTVVDVLGGRHVLLVLDNCEHLAWPCAQLVERLLRACPHVQVLATSREPLGLLGEVAWRVPCLSEAEAVELFAQRVYAAEPGLADAIGERTAAVSEICRRLDGLPLAIELAAARARVMSPEELVMRLGDRFSVLIGGARLAPPRHQTLRAAVDWSYELLDERERLLFDRLSVFAGSFSLAGAESVCTDQDLDVLDLLARLVDRSLVLVERPADVSETRYRLLETLRAYGWERLQANSGNADMVRGKHAAWTLQLAEQADRAFHGPDEERWLERLEHERDNARAALGWATSQGDPDTALRLVAALGWFEGLRGPWSEGRMWVERALTMAGAETPTAARANALVHAARLAVFQADFGAAEAWIREALTLGQQLTREDVVLAARGVSTLLLQFTGADEDAEQLANEVLVEATRLGQFWWAGRMLCIQASGAERRGDTGAATTRLEEAIGLARRTGDRWSQAMALNQLGDVERAQQAYARAGELYAESLALRGPAGGGGTGEASVWHNLGYVALANGDLAGAESNFQHALALFVQLGEHRGAAESLVGVAAVAAADGRAEVAARLFGAGEAILTAVGSRVWQSNRPEYERWVAMARAGLASDVFESAWSVGRQTSLEDALIFAGAN